MGKTAMGAVVSLDGFIADDNDDVGPLFDSCGTIVAGDRVTHFVYDVSR